MPDSPILNIAFYRFVDLAMPAALGPVLRERCVGLGLKGTILLSGEGINANLAGAEEAIREFRAFLEAIPEFAGMEMKQSWSERAPFGRLRVKLKREIIPMGAPEVRPARLTGARLRPLELKQWLDQGRELLLLDTRNEYEIRHGTFHGARSLGLGTFRQFGPRLEREFATAAERQRPIVMFCTGGIRCEKATAYALERGFTEVYQLEGGILKYFEQCGRAHYEGDCYVFDERGALDAALKPGSRP